MRSSFCAAIVASVCGAVLLVGSQPASSAGPPAGRQELFNGENLRGWSVAVEEQGEVDLEEQHFFQVENGVIHVYPDVPAGSRQPFACLTTDREYADYRLTLEYKWGARKFEPRLKAARDAGLLYHVHGPNMVWPAGVECQIQEGDTGDTWAVRTQIRTTVEAGQPDENQWQFAEPDKGGQWEIIAREPGRNLRVIKSHTNEVDGWNQVEVIVRGDEATHIVNGEAVNRVYGMRRWDPATKSWQPLKKGRIALQAEGAELFYRNIRIELLPEEESRSEQPRSGH